MMLLRKIFSKFFPKEEFSQKHVFFLFSFIFVVWALYRYFPEILPEWIEELILKPLVWLIPTIWVVNKVEKQSLASIGFRKTNLFPSFYWGIGMGMIFALEGLIANLIKYGRWEFASFQATPRSFFGILFLSFATAISEETVFRGYIFNRLWRIWKNEWLANLVSSILFAIIHLPIAVFTLGYTPAVMIVYLFFVFLYAAGAAFVFGRTENIFSCILLHVFWSWPIILFK